MKIQNVIQIIKKLTLAMISLSVIACASKPEPTAEIYSNEPIVVANDSNRTSRYDAPPSSEPAVDNSSQTNSSGITAPSDSGGFTEPPVDEMNGITPPAETNASNEEPMVDTSADDMAQLDSMTDTTTEPEPAVEEPMMAETGLAAASISEAPADHYTIQVVASSTMENLNAFATRHGLSSDLTAQVVVGDKTWNVLLVGTYATLGEAKNALAGIDATITTSPWIRKVGSLQ